MTEPRILNSRYDLGDLIGRGGMADVYHARDIRLGREVAIKLLRRDLARDPVFQTRFRREAQAVAGLNHPSIVAVYDTGEEEVDGAAAHDVKVPYIVMEYVQGRTLRDLLKAGELTADSSIRYTLGVLGALQYSHRKGIVHRDIKPSNVMVTTDDHVKVMDFGIARALADSAATMTQTQAVVGTAHYFSPEQARGETVDARSDLYSAGCLLYELLTGRPPFTGDSPVSVAYQHVSEEAAAPSALNAEIGPKVDEVIATALAKDREDRYQDAGAFATALEAAVEDRPVPQDRGDATEALAVMPLSTQALVTTDQPTRALATDAPASSTGPADGNGTPDTDEDSGPATTAIAATAATDAPTGRQPAIDEEGYGRERHDDAALFGSDPRHTDEDAERYRTSRRRAWITVFAILAVVVLAAGAWMFWNWSQQEQQRNATVTVPDVSNLSLTAAQNQIYASNLIPITEEVYDDEIESGSVVGTRPAAGSQARQQSEIHLLVSQGPEQVTLPKDLAGQSEATVRSTLDGLGLKVSNDVKRENSASVDLGSLIGTNPQLGEKVKAGSEVELTLSTGKVTVPSLMDLDEDKAREVLSDPAVGLELEVVEKPNTVLDPGTITNQVPEAGQDIDQGGTVTITVATEPPEEPSESPSPTEDASGSPAPSDGASESAPPESTHPGNGKGHGKPTNPGKPSK
ncbi:Stk1 family PASTA domain-containing Ser/Thr kinase [Arthrobacter sp. JSM 101049]|uniref:Stk1 family PASTA domain-containing Ser/Thr kinase n=1 Tax=Arthrobacter sp. JSM 101049 TaxID=929097 RepID=UPI00356B5AB5